jgi:cobalt/nickel transport protein
MKEKAKKGLTTTKKLWIVIGILLLLSPLGVILPVLFKAHGAWGEWGRDTIEKMVGFMPDGMKRLGDVWKAPMTGYTIPGQSRGLASDSIGYILTGIVGVAIIAGIMYLLAKLVGRGNGRGK